MLVRKSVYLFGVLMTHFNQKYIKSPSREYSHLLKFSVLFKGFWAPLLYFIYEINNRTPFLPPFLSFLCAVRMKWKIIFYQHENGNIINRSSTCIRWINTNKVSDFRYKYG